MKLTRFREVAIHWSPETRANRPQDLDDPIWLLNCVSEMYSTALRLGRVSSKGVRKLNIYLGPNEDQKWDALISGGIASIRLMDSLSTMNLRDGRAVNSRALDMIRQAVSMLACNDANCAFALGRMASSMNVSTALRPLARAVLRTRPSTPT